MEGKCDELHADLYPGCAGCSLLGSLAEDDGYDEQYEHGRIEMISHMGTRIIKGSPQHGTAQQSSSEHGVA